jgi:transcription elongation factor Elf1
MGTILKSFPCPQCQNPVIISMSIDKDKKLILICPYCGFHEGPVPQLKLKIDPTFFPDSMMN